ncbi:MAG: hypothetical protein HGA67_04420 [Candidatus Yonathbacteria bacterium]|nr:hypothetical protein [Candidatus Yonathbacteria bacterium]
MRPSWKHVAGLGVSGAGTKMVLHAFLLFLVGITLAQFTGSYGAIKEFAIRTNISTIETLFVISILSLLFGMGTTALCAGQKSYRLGVFVSALGGLSFVISMLLFALRR